ncbi:MAG: phosphatase PAP2 family protein [Candidatus Uhrbacteria bacterium]|nr:phosphatase PAP2 family protein [Candidatus Uhrbacteria bacterium]
MNIDHKLSHGLFNLARFHWVGRHLAILAGTHIIWMMLGVLLAATAWQSSAQTFTLNKQTVFVLIFLLPAWGLTMLLSKFVNRERPFEELHEKPLIAPFVRTASFPSTHATFAFSMAAMCAVFFPSLLPFMLVAAFAVALGRVAAGLHFFSDIIVGALVGFGVTPYAIAIIMVALGYD